jgi:Contractile injection system tape measure protein
MPNSLHRVRRLSWNVNTASASEAFALRVALGSGWQDVLRVWDEVFDQTIRNYSSSDADPDIHIPKIELNVVVAPGVEILALLPELLRQQIQEQLLLVLGPSSDRSNEFMGSELSSSRLLPIDLLLHYLQTGSVHWTMAHLVPVELAHELRQIFNLHRAQLCQQLSVQPATASSYFRLFQLLGVAEREETMGVLVDNSPAEWRQELFKLIDFICHDRRIAPSDYLQCHLLSALFAAALNSAASGLGLDFSQILSTTFDRLGLNGQDFLAFIPPHTSVEPIAPTGGVDPIDPEAPTARDKSQPSPTLNSNNAEPPDPPSRNRADWRSTSLGRDPGGDRNGNEVPQEMRSHWISPAGTEQQQDLRSEWNDAAIPQREFPRLVNHAGLILLHPFLNPFLTTVDLYDPEQPAIAPAQLPRAAALLHFLAAGSAEPYEYELGAIKILLGLEPETPLLLGSGLLTESDRREAESLLEAVLAHWTILKNTSISGLRSSFLQRSGLLSRTEAGWRLQIERQSFDMLLDSLPWSISLIKLPWMKYLLYNEW